MFLNAIKGDNCLVPVENGFSYSKFGNVTEDFLFDRPGYQTEHQLQLVYARNTGYEAYRVNWGRKVVVCTNGLTVWKGSQARWKHTREVGLQDFIKQAVVDGVGNQDFLEGCIEKASSIPLKKEILSEFINRCSLARATKERIISRVVLESKVVGLNEWALSQALTWLGSHEKSISYKVRPEFTKLGTVILEDSLEAVLQLESEIKRDGMYGFILP
jgi:hypothetical protein